MGEFRKMFTESGDFAAFNAACRWCESNGIAYGSMQRGDPIGLMVGDYAIEKWRNLSAQDRAELHGTITGSDKRNGPITVTIFDDALMPPTGTPP